MYILYTILLKMFISLNIIWYLIHSPSFWTGCGKKKQKSNSDDNNKLLTLCKQDLNKEMTNFEFLNSIYITYHVSFNIISRF